MTIEIAETGSTTIYSDRWPDVARVPRGRLSAVIAAAPLSRGSRYSVCCSLPLLGVNSSRKCGSRAFHGPGMPSCWVAVAVSPLTVTETVAVVSPWAKLSVPEVAR